MRAAWKYCLYVWIALAATAIAAPRTEAGSLKITSAPSGATVEIDDFAVLCLTHAHVVNGADKINVRIKDGRTLEGKLVGIDEKTDIAIIKVDAKDLPVATLANSDTVRVGEIVFAIDWEKVCPDPDEYHVPVFPDPGAWHDLLRKKKVWIVSDRPEGCPPDTFVQGRTFARRIADRRSTLVPLTRIERYCLEAYRFASFEGGKVRFIEVLPKRSNVSDSRIAIEQQKRT